MPGVIFHWDHKRGASAAWQKALFQRYDYTCRAFGVDKVAMVDADGTFDLGLPPYMVRVPSLGLALAEFPGRIQVFVSKAAASVGLNGYYHPDNAIYIVGPDFSWLGVPDGAECVRIDYPEERMELWASAALGIVLYDRSAKV